MNGPRLVFLSGPLQGKTIALEQGDVWIGREEANTVVLNHASVSRKHCRIQKTADGYAVSDLDSKNGTFVDGLPRRSANLQHGTELRIGNTHALFLDRSDDAPAGFLDDDPAGGGSTIILHEADILYTRSGDPRLREAAAAARLSQLLAMTRAISQARTMDGLAGVLLPMLMEAVPARRTALLAGDDLLNSPSGWFHVRNTGDSPAFRVSRTVLQRSISQREFILQGGFPAELAPSLVAEGVQSLLCVPLIRLDRALGALYMDTAAPLPALTEEHLQFVSAAAGIAALAVESIRLIESLQEENRFLKQENSGADYGIVGDSAAMRRVFDFIQKAAPTDLTVLVLGESGVGKELVARAIHGNGPRAAASFIAVNCAAFTESLLESDLFGHEKGAFTGAVQQRKGKFERADGGTLFLDEVAELSPAIQAKLLRVLQEREFERVGGSRPIRVDVRLIAATNRELKEEVRKGTFREDLYYRLNVLSVRVPPLREHPEDLPLLATHFLARSCERLHKPARSLGARTRSALLQYSWPGNVRELQNAMERAVALSEAPTIEPEDLPECVLEAASDPVAGTAQFQEAIRETKKKVILEAVRTAAGNLTEAARSLGVNPNYLHRLIRNLNLRSQLPREK